ncbi:MAG: hypothetical protein ACK5KR_04240 [Breznakia sp.]
MENEIQKISKLDKFQNTFIKFGSFMGRQRHLSAIRDAFGAFLPFLIVGAMSLMIAEVFIAYDGLIATIFKVDGQSLVN